MHLARVLFLPSLLLALLAGCRPAQPATASATGSVQVAASTSQALASSDVSRVTVTSSAADMPSIVTELVETDGVWGGVIGNIPAGVNRTVLAQAFDSAGTLRYEGRAEGITVMAGTVTLVTLVLQEMSPEAPYANEAPLIDSVVASPMVVAPGASVALVARAHDPNPGDSLAYAWTAPSGSFVTPSGASTTWSAPSTSGPVTLTLSVSDSHGAASSVSLTVNVSTGDGDAVLDVRFNHRPVVVGLTSSQSALDVGQQTLLSVSASDSDRDTLSYQWSASCAGSFEGADTATPRFTPTALPAGTCNNCQLTAVVSDGRGGQGSGTLSLCVGSTLQLPPTVVRSFQSSLSARPSQLLTLEVVGSDPAGSTLSFSWSAAAGTLGTAVDSATSSRVTWTAPACVPAGTSSVLTATVTNGFGLTATRAFSVTGLPTCDARETVSLGHYGSYYNHIGADGTLFFTGYESLLRYDNPTSGGTPLQADLDGDAVVEHTFRSGGTATGLWGGSRSNLTTDAQGNVYRGEYGGVSGSGWVITKLDARADYAPSTWQTGCVAAQVAADATHLYAACDGYSPTLKRYELATGLESPLTVTGVPSSRVYTLDANGGYIYLATNYEIGRFPAGGGAYERLVGTGENGFGLPHAADGATANASPIYTVGIGIDADGKVFFSDMRDGALGPSRLRYVDADGKLRTVSGFTPGINAGLTVRGHMLMAQDASYQVTLLSPLP